ncbi:hypothetical protein [uncultured Desulfobacter sp.]|uniref:hypothetical protein n=1 Tax=uncultured Desulfobacter sp. TaxID=240139 RepID=UPI002AAB9308|nr:hypothetical protein [uncultured Desulfobacter sp.]
MINKSRPISEARARIIIEGISRMHYDAVNLSGGELELGVPFLKNLLDTFPIQFVSTNIGLNPSQWEKIADTYIIKEVNGVKVAITGVSAKVLLNDDVQKDKNVIISSPISTLKPVLSKLKDQVDLVILLSQMTIKGTKNFLTYNALPEVGVVIAGHGRNLTPQAVQVKDTLVVQNSMGGEYLSVLNLELDDSLNIKGHSVEIIPLTDEVPEDPVLLEKMKQFKATTSKIQAKSHKTEQQLGNQKELLQLSPEAFIKYQSEMENK